MQVALCHVLLANGFNPCPELVLKLIGVLHVHLVEDNNVLPGRVLWVVHAELLANLGPEKGKQGGGRGGGGGGGTQQGIKSCLDPCRRSSRETLRTEPQASRAECRQTEEVPYDEVVHDGVRLSSVDHVHEDARAAKVTQKHESQASALCNSIHSSD